MIYCLNALKNDVFQTKIAIGLMLFFVFSTVVIIITFFFNKQTNERFEQKFQLNMIQNLK